MRVLKRSNIPERPELLIDNKRKENKKKGIKNPDQWRRKS